MFGHKAKRRQKCLYVGNKDVLGIKSLLDPMAKDLYFEDEVKRHED